jgi:tetratricopeptide (TPR) repeat protein
MKTGLMALGFSLLLVTPLVHAEDPVDRTYAEARFSRGLELADAGRFAEAAIAFEEAYARVPHFAVLRNVGRAWAAAGRPSSAIDAYQRFLSEGRERIAASVRQQVEQEVRVLGALTTTVSIISNPADASVKVDGQPRGRTPLSLERVDAGRHLVAIEAAGFLRKEVEIVLEAKEPRSLDYTLDRMPVAPAPAPPPAPTRSPARADVAAELAKARASERALLRQQRRTWGYVLSGSGLVLGIAAGTLV